MEYNLRLNTLNACLASCRAQYDEMIARAEQVLEQRRVEHAQAIAQSKNRIAVLESQLEIFEGLEHEREAANIRKELAAANNEHKAIVKEADRKLEEAVLFQVKSFASAGIALEASFNAGVSRLPA